MKEAKFLGALLPSSPDFLPIIQSVREKYDLPEISPKDDPIEKIYLGDEIVPLEEFRQDIENRLRENLGFMPPETAKLYQSAKSLQQANIGQELDTLTDNMKTDIEKLFEFLKTLTGPVIQLLDIQIKSIADMLCYHLLTGETEDAPLDWFGKAGTFISAGEPIVFAIANEVSNLDDVIQQFREEHKRNFGEHHRKVTNTATSTAYYLRLKKEKKPWQFMVEEYIRLNKFSLPRDRNSKRYSEIWNLYAQRLKKRIKRTRAILDVLVRDKK